MTKIKEIMVPDLMVDVTREILHEDVKDTHRNIKGMFALQQQFYFSSLRIFQEATKTEEKSMLRIIFVYPEKKRELKEKLSLAGLTQLDILVNPGTVEVRYPKYDTKWEYRDTDVYNTVFIENQAENPVKTLRIAEESKELPELFFVEKKNSWSMREWPEILLYPEKELFEQRLDSLLNFFDIEREDFERAVTSSHDDFLSE